MKKIFTNAQCMHVYAQQTQEQGRTNNGNVFFEGTKTIYSYGYHFPMCHFLDDGKTALYNDDHYSMSTSQQQADLRQAISHYKILRVSTPVIKSFVSSGQFSKFTQTTLTADALDKMVAFIGSAAKRRKEELRNSDIAQALHELINAREIFEHFGVKPPHKITSRIKNIQENEESILEMHRNEQKARAVKAKREEKKRQKEMEGDAVKWREGEHVMYISRYNKTMLRVKGENVETSKGASFPSKHAKPAFYKILDCVRTATPWQTNGRTINLGNFKIDYIHENGDVRAGCHFVEYSEIEKIAKELDLAV